MGMLDATPHVPPTFVQPGSWPPAPTGSSAPGFLSRLASNVTVWSAPVSTTGGEFGHAPQSAEQLEQVSAPLHRASPQIGGQSAEQVEGSSSPTSHVPFPQ